MKDSLFTVQEQIIIVLNYKDTGMAFKLAVFRNPIAAIVNACESKFKALTYLYYHFLPKPK